MLYNINKNTTSLKVYLVKNISKILLFIIFAVSLTGCYNSSSNNTAKNENLTEYIALYSIWDSQLNINFNANDGDGTMAKESVTKGSDFTIPPNTFTRLGYAFHGWNTNADGSGTSYEDEATIENLTEDITLYAVWDLRLDIFFNANDGDGTMAEETVTKGFDLRDLPIRLPDPVIFSMAGIQMPTVQEQVMRMKQLLKT